MAKKPGFMIYNDWKGALMSLPATALKEFLGSIFYYTETGEEPQFKNPRLPPLWELMRSKLDYDTRRYEKISEQHRNAVNARWERERQNGESGSEDEPKRGQSRYGKGGGKKGESSASWDDGMDEYI